MAARAMMNNQAARNVAMGQKRANHRTHEEEIEESRLEDARKRAEDAIARCERCLPLSGRRRPTLDSI